MTESVKTLEKVKAAKTAGILTIIAGAIFIVCAIFGTWLLWALVNAFTSPSSGAESMPLWVIAMFTIPMAIIGVVAVIGGREALRHRRWGLALAGAICAIFCFWPLGIPALTLIISSRHDFT
jgi:predicted phage tail protein